jgi:hypothetical protein
MKKALVALLVSMILVPAGIWAYTTSQRSKAIHIVYDDSGSMISDGKTYLDRWGQAKYAMEVFAAMLEEKDIMRVYYMSDFDLSVGGKVNASAKITISGTESAKTRVSKIHDTITYAANTPYDAVAKAYADLKSAAADEKWLVVLTDGEFNRLNGQNASNINVDGFFSQYVRESGVKIMFLAMGDNFTKIKPDPDREIYFEQARNSNEILGRITSICNRIFNRNKLRFTNEARREFSFDIPMIELLVFAQGPDVKINGIKGSKTYNPSETVNVRYSNVAAKNYANDPKVVISRGLTGVVASFKDVPKGAYSLDISGAQTVEVYYKPFVNVDIKLFQNGKEIHTQNIPEGDYQIKFGIVNENKEFFESALLGKVEYEATAKNTGQAIPIQSDGTISLKRGELAVQVQSHFLKINTAENTITRRIMGTPTPLDVEIKKPAGEFAVSNLDSAKTFIMTVKHEGKLLTEPQWQSMSMPSVTSDAKVEIAGIRRGTDASTFQFYIKHKKGDKFATSTGDVTLNAVAELEYDDQVCIGESSATVNIKDDISWLSRFFNWTKKFWYIFWPLVLLFLWWIFWGRKKRFPKYMSKKPEIMVETGDGSQVTTFGSFKIIPKTRQMPLCPERGTIVAVANDKPLPPLKVTAKGNESMELTNAADFAADKLDNVGGERIDFTINNMPLPEGATKRTMNCNAKVISVFHNLSGGATTHTCSLSKRK